MNILTHSPATQYPTYIPMTRLERCHRHYIESQRQQARKRNEYWRSLDYANIKHANVMHDIVLVLERLR